MNFLSDGFIPEADAVFRGKARGVIEASSPPEGIHIAFFNTLFLTAEHHSVHHRRADALALILFPGADRLYQCCFCLPIHIDKTVSAYIVVPGGFLIRIWIPLNAGKCLAPYYHITPQHAMTSAKNRKVRRPSGNAAAYYSPGTEGNTQAGFAIFTFYRAGECGPG